MQNASSKNLHGRLEPVFKVAASAANPHRENVYQ